MPRIFFYIGGIFAAIGLAFLVGSGWMWAQQRDFSRSAVRAEGEVVALVPRRSSDGDGVTYAAQVRFSDRTGQVHQWTEQGSTNPPRFATGERVPVLYDPQSPESAVVDDLWGRRGALLIIGPLGALFTVFGLLFVILERRGAGQDRRLLRSGLPIDARFLHVFRDTRVKIKGDYPFRVVAQGNDPQTGTPRRYESQPIWVDPTEQLQDRTVRVMVDPTRPNRYVMDLSAVLGDAYRA
ncbi:hypothetical protein NT2_05_00240 [Caenibius tardaugens NBRC 16725]|uniref:DUF3592 domain-containing protein n=1 Tax=Caenibius tardaugens NBRC 16725 TaxID=1219035 RepID=U3A2W4_9SPHN|nr:DUF3592 domain-containing protein [Caenibius tardaugens]AZI36469.1 DUF3592 domain-containing protein [Caenibius tardaugens NBRC 16725]GAD49103.1 hypothetical protein NT2_05_00240 [Caenibius tardaugens NBRC 16725]